MRYIRGVGNERSARSFATERRNRRDVIDIVEASYASTPETREWLENVVGAAAPLLDAGFGVFGMTVEAIAPTRIELGEFVVRGCGSAVEQFVTEATSSLPIEDFRATYGSPAVFDSMSGRAGRRYSDDHWMFVAFRERLGAPDFDLLRVVDHAGFGCLLAAARPRVASPSRREKARWARVAAHLVTGLRLHRAMRAEQHDTSPLEQTAVEAVLDPGGKLLDARGPAAESRARNELREAARRIDRARSSLGRRDEQAALDAWRALVEGRWSMIDVFDSDGRRFVVARENRPATSRIATLTRREQDVVAYARLGWSNKLIAYTLGLSESTVSETLRRALDRLGLRSRADLVGPQELRGS